MRFDFYGVIVEVASEAPELLEDVRRDFSWFATHGTGPVDVGVRAALGEPQFPTATAARARLVQPKFVAYDDGPLRWVDYQGRALARWDQRVDRTELWSTDEDLLHELTYLLVLSRVGERHDERGIHRVHALGLEARGKAVVCMLPSGGGKTTLGLASLADPDVRLLSDDTPLVTRSGDVLAFPVRVGCARKPAEIAERYLRRFARREHGAKWLVDIEAFSGRIASRSPPGALVLGERQLTAGARIEPASRRSIAAELFRSAVVGVGLPQVIEYFLRFDARDVVRKTKLVGSRAAACAALARRSRRFRLLLSRRSEENQQALATLLHGM